VHDDQNVLKEQALSMNVVVDPYDADADAHIDAAYAAVEIEEVDIRDVKSVLVLHAHFQTVLV
jgi:hypothetical protein